MSARRRGVSGSVSTCQALTAASAPEDTHSKGMGNAAGVSGVMNTHTHTSVTVWCMVYTHYGNNSTITITHDRNILETVFFFKKCR